MRALLALLLLHDGQSASSLETRSSRRRFPWSSGNCLAVFHTKNNFLGNSYIAGVVGNGECQSHETAVDNSPGVVTAASGHFWARSRCRFQIYRSTNCRHSPWLNLDARILKVSWTNIVSEIGGPAGLVSKSKVKFGSAKCTCIKGAATDYVLLQRQAGNSSIAEEAEDDDEDYVDDEDDEEEDADDDDDEGEDEGEEGEKETLDEAPVNEAGMEVDDVEGDHDVNETHEEGKEVLNEMSLLEGADEASDGVNETSEEEESLRGRRRRAFLTREHRACSYLFYRAKNSWTHPYTLGKVRKNKCITFKTGFPGIDFWRGFAFADNRCHIRFHSGKHCESHSWVFTPGWTPYDPQGTARLSFGFRGWSGAIKSVGCRCW